MSNSSDPITLMGSTARNPDLNWSQVRETILMLELAIAQIDVALRDSDGSVSVLTNTFTAMMGFMNDIQEEIAKLPEEGECKHIKDRVTRYGQSVTGMMQESIVAFQFYDKLTQRLNHVGVSVKHLSELISSPVKLYNPAEWVKLQEEIRGKYTMAEEVLMFDAIMEGGTVEEALARYRAALEESKKKLHDIELF